MYSPHDHQVMMAAQALPVLVARQLQHSLEVLAVAENLASGHGRVAPRAHVELVHEEMERAETVVLVHLSPAGSGSGRSTTAEHRDLRKSRGVDQLAPSQAPETVRLNHIPAHDAPLVNAR